MSCHHLKSRVKSQQPPRSILATTTRPYEACVWNLAAAIAPLKKRRWGDVHVRSTRFNQWQGLPPWSYGEWFETAAVQWHLPNLFGRSVAWQVMDLDEKFSASTFRVCSFSQGWNLGSRLCNPNHVATKGTKDRLEPPSNTGNHDMTT
jgi:hypothetical protein